MLQSMFVLAVLALTAGPQMQTRIRVVVAGADSIVLNNDATAFCRGLPTALDGCGGPGGGPITVPDAKHELFIERDDLRRRALEPVLKFFSPPG
jgi:lysophospholipase